MYKKYLKRFLDIFLSLLGLPILIIVLILFAPIIYLTDKGSIFYNAPRLGRNGAIFKMYKLRSMYLNSPDIRLEDGSTYNASDDPRVTPIGRFLRKTSLDEAPQIINVLKGEMSVVGPRPDLPDIVDLYGENQHIRMSVRPGITGYCQAYFRNNIRLEDRFENDAYYARNISFKMDIRIIFKTAVIVLLQKKVYRDADTKEYVSNE